MRLRQTSILVLLFSIVACSTSSAPNRAEFPLRDARQSFKTNIVRTEPAFGAADDPSGSDFDLIRYDAPVGKLAAYLSKNPGDGLRHPAIVWITGGETQSIGDIWSPQSRSNDQSAAAYRKAGIIMMFPSQRGGNDNPGQREGFLGEADDILAATDYLASLPYVDTQQIYLGGHSTGGTLAMLVAESTDRYRAVFAFGPAAWANQYGGDFVFADLKDDRELALRSPYEWLADVRRPLYVFEGSEQGNWDGAIEIMATSNKNPNIHFFRLDGHSHFSVLAPVNELLAAQIVRGNIDVREADLSGLK
ncbi:peptidase [Ahniella affigens]|uniref:Peptidase n=1 Tax=Ahniella affigens TaxID=2021234 RepID=A0A2P1PZ07_9GAMM|nr:prolyl oligopeptidase family serine peptidase [Ahniella affigens]AVQ00074.1 peptidase [Ahniella affigens]